MSTAGLLRAVRLKERGLESGRMITGARKGAVEWYGIGLAEGPEGSPPDERFTERKSSKSPTNDHTANGSGEQSGPEMDINGYKSEAREVIDKKGPLHPLHPPEDEKCIHDFPGGLGCGVCDPALRGGAERENAGDVGH